MRSGKMNRTPRAEQWFECPEHLPLRTIEQIWAARVLVVAPHPDDECLGCGGAIAMLAGCCDLRVLVITNGTMSHPNSRQFPAAALRALRESETRAAMNYLGVEPAAVHFLGLQDGAVPMKGIEGDAIEGDATGGDIFDIALQQCRDYLAEAQPQLIFLPWRADPHPDHRASWQLINAALPQPAPRRVEYPIWDWDEAQRGSIPSHIDVWRLNIQAVLPQKRAAISLYRSQVSDLIDDDPDGFRLSSEMLERFLQPWEIYFEEIT